MMKKNSPYTSAFTACSFLFSEFNAVLPLLRSDNADLLLKDESVNRHYLMVNNEASARKILLEFKRRYKTVPIAFWDWYDTLDETAQKAALLYVILKTYKLLFDFHIHVAIKKWNSVDHTLTTNDLQMELLDVSANDEFVDSWSVQTKKKLMSAYLTILRQADMMDSKTNELRPLRLMPNEYKYYIENGELWFLDACLLTPMEKDNIINAYKTI